MMSSSASYTHLDSGSQLIISEVAYDGSLLNAEEIISRQLAFYKKGRAGCLFAAVAAKKPSRYGWVQHVVFDFNQQKIDGLIEEAINTPDVTMVSLIFPTVTTPELLMKFIDSIQSGNFLFLEQSFSYEDMQCLGLRARIGSLSSWVSGFGPFEFFPLTRQAPYTELAFRVKPRPNYKKVLKPSPPNVIHLADLHMINMTWTVFRSLWFATFNKVEKILGRKPNQKSAAKTTFVVPWEQWLKASSSNGSANSQ